MEVNKFSAFLLSFVFFIVAIDALFNGSLTIKGVYISGMLAYMLSGINFILGILFLFIAFRQIKTDKPNV